MVKLLQREERTKDDEKSGNSWNNKMRKWFIWRYRRLWKLSRMDKKRADCRANSKKVAWRTRRFYSSPDIYISELYEKFTVNETENYFQNQYYVKKYFRVGRLAHCTKITEHIWFSFPQIRKWVGCIEIRWGRVSWRSTSFLVGSCCDGMITL